ncbi:MAG TPA: substrate-binding domain-containing protein [Phycisphaerae bacterium]|nr:substrate-binding domain-containing protein [Phycisphaerae bacterium]
MNILKLAMAAVAMAVAVGVAGCGGDSANPTTQGGGGSGKTIKLAVIPKGTQHVFWKSVEAGARSAAKDLNVEMEWKGPILENDRASQIQIVSQFINKHPDGIVLAPLDYEALVDPVHDATAAKIPVVIIDSALKGEPGKDFVSFVATNNKQGGVMAGEQLAKVLNNKGKVILLRYLEGSASTTDREQGFLDTMKKYNMEVLVSNIYGGPGASEAQTKSLQMINQIKQADGIFASNEPTTLGMLQALRQNELAGKKKFVGFDASDELVDALKKGEIDALVAQNPVKMGYEGVKAVVRQIRGEKVEPVIDSGAALITKENVDSAEVKTLLGK